MTVWAQRKGSDLMPSYRQWGFEVDIVIDRVSTDCRLLLLAGLSFPSSIAAVVAALQRITAAGGYQ